MTGHDGTTERAVERGKPHGARSIAPEDELDTVCAEATGAVVQQDRSCLFAHAGITGCSRMLAGESRRLAGRTPATTLDLCLRSAPCLTPPAPPRFRARRQPRTSPDTSLPMEPGESGMDARTQS